MAKAAWSPLNGKNHHNGTKKGPKEGQKGPRPIEKIPKNAIFQNPIPRFRTIPFQKTLHGPRRFERTPRRNYLFLDRTFPQWRSTRAPSYIYSYPVSTVPVPYTSHNFLEPKNLTILWLGWAYMAKTVRNPQRGGVNFDPPMICCACSMQNVPAASEMYQDDFRTK